MNCGSGLKQFICVIFNMKIEHNIFRDDGRINGSQYGNLPRSQGNNNI